MGGLRCCGSSQLCAAVRLLVLQAAARGRGREAQGSRPSGGKRSGSVSDGCRQPSRTPGRRAGSRFEEDPKPATRCGHGSWGRQQGSQRRSAPTPRRSRLGLAWPCTQPEAELPARRLGQELRPNKRHSTPCNRAVRAAQAKSATAAGSPLEQKLHLLGRQLQVRGALKQRAAGRRQERGGGAAGQGGRDRCARSARPARQPRQTPVRRQARKVRRRPPCAVTPAGPKHACRQPGSPDALLVALGHLLVQVHAPEVQALGVVAQNALKQAAPALCTAAQ